MNLIGSTEEHAPEEAERVSWALLTNLPVGSFAEASEKVDWYAKRWGIETWHKARHKVLKSGGQVQDCPSSEAERLARYVTLFRIIGVRLMYIAYLARVQPDLSARKVFSEVEIPALALRMTKDNLKREKPTKLQETAGPISKLGGHVRHKCDGEPAVVVLCRGWMRLY